MTNKTVSPVPVDLDAWSLTTYNSNDIDLFKPRKLTREEKLDSLTDQYNDIIDQIEELREELESIQNEINGLENDEE